MNRMRKYGLLQALLCLLLTTGCGNLYTGEETLFDPELGETVRDEQVPIMVAFDDPYYNILSRGVGKIDPEDTYFHDKMSPKDPETGELLPVEKRPRFFIYAFKKVNNYGYRVTRKDDKGICLVDGSTGTQGEWARQNPEEMLEGHGKWAVYSGNGSFVDWRYTENDLFYSQESPKEPYDFFAYHHGGAVSGPVTRDENRISFPVTIDGSQDLMCGIAALTEEQLNTIREMEDAEEREQIEAFHYSTFTGQRNIWPVFRLRHQLAYVKFNLIAGNAYGDPVRVHEVSLRTHTQGNFVVVARNHDEIKATFDPNGEQKWLNIRHLKDGSELTPERWDEISALSVEEGGYRLEYYSEEEQLANDGKERPDPYPAGELLVPPGDDTVLRMTLSNNDTFGNPEVTEIPLKGQFGKGTGLVAGKTYNLNITVYGPKQISIDVEASPWKDGGDVNIDIEDNEK